jgi:hypothetical protein
MFLEGGAEETVFEEDAVVDSIDIDLQEETALPREGGHPIPAGEASLPFTGKDADYTQDVSRYTQQPGSDVNDVSRYTQVSFQEDERELAENTRIHAAEDVPAPPPFTRTRSVGSRAERNQRIRRSKKK